MNAPIAIKPHAIAVVRGTEQNNLPSDAHFAEARFAEVDGHLAAAHEPPNAAMWAAPPRRLSPALIINRVAAFDVAIVIVLSVISKLLYIDWYLADDTPTFSYLTLGCLLGIILHFFYKQLDIYEPGFLRDRSLRIGKLWAGLALSFLILLGLLYLFKLAELYSRGWMLIWLASSALALAIARAMTLKIVAGLSAEGKICYRVAVFGLPELVRQSAEHLKGKCPDIEVIGCYWDESEPTQHGENDGGLHKLLAAAHDGRFEQIVLVFRPNDYDRIRTAVTRLALVPAELYLCTDLSLDRVRFRDSRTFSGRPHDFGGLRIDIVMGRPPSEAWKSAKAALDLTTAAVALVLLSPVLILTALAIKLDSEGPVLFRQRRFGYNNRVFRIYKFRTMRVAEDGNSVQQVQRGDRRITTLGAFLRRTSIDELPQLINVLKGDMSIVGPRPHALIHNELFAQQLENYPWRHRVKPGITGWAQIHGFRGETRTAEDIRRRIDHDLYYIDNWSIWLDLEIIVRTIFALVDGRRAY